MSLRPVLRPGHDVVRRDAGTLLVTGPGDVTLADEPGLVDVLRLLDGRTVDQVAAHARRTEYGGDVPALVRRLLAAGVLGDAAGPARPRLTVRVQPTPGAADVAAVLGRAVDDLALGNDEQRALLVLVSCDEPERRWLERALGAGIPTLPVVALAGSVRLGPLAVPGISPCLGCHDAERAEWDPAWAARLAQRGRPLVRSPPARPPVPLLWRAAGALAAEVDDLARGRRPSTSGSTLLLDDDGRHRRPVSFHHRCACTLLSTG